MWIKYWNMKFLLRMWKDIFQYLFQLQYKELCAQISFFHWTEQENYSGQVTSLCSEAHISVTDSWNSRLVTILQQYTHNFVDQHFSNCGSWLDVQWVANHVLGHDAKFLAAQGLLRRPWESFLGWSRPAIDSIGLHGLRMICRSECKLLPVCGHNFLFDRKLLLVASGHSENCGGQYSGLPALCDPEEASWDSQKRPCSARRNITSQPSMEDESWLLKVSEPLV